MLHGYALEQKMRVGTLNGLTNNLFGTTIYNSTLYYLHTLIHTYILIS